VDPLTLIPDAATMVLPTAVPKPTSRSGQREATHVAWSDGPVRAGVWECDRGEFTTSRDGLHEVCHVLRGVGRLTADDGTVSELTPGTTVVIPDGWSGVWQIDEDMRKTFVIVTTRS